MRIPRTLHILASASVSNDATPHMPDALNGVWHALKNNGYAVTTDQSIGLPEKFRPNFLGAYFNNWTLRHDPGDFPVDRLRARDVVRYRWQGERLSLQRHDAITITDRAGIAGRREHARIELLEDPQARDLIRALLHLLPPARRQPEGTFGVNLFRTFTNVVTKPHHDNEQFIIIYVLDRIGGRRRNIPLRPSRRHGKRRDKGAADPSAAAEPGRHHHFRGRALQARSHTAGQPGRRYDEAGRTHLHCRLPRYLSGDGQLTRPQDAQDPWPV